MPSADYRSKIVSLTELTAALDQARQRGLRVVQCHGCFDIVHPGHIRHLEFARKLGEVLLVSLTSDSAISKGPQRPYIPQELRAENLAALTFVDYVHIDCSPTAESLLALTRPDFYVKGREYEHVTDGDLAAERRVVESNGGRVIFSSGEVTFSSTRLGETLQRQGVSNRQRLDLLCRRHTINHDRLGALVAGFADRRVLVIGDIIVDRYMFCDAIDIASESPMLSLNQLDERHYLGGAAIVARHIKGLGARPFLVGACGKDPCGDWARQILHDEQIDAYLIDNRRETVQKTRYLVNESKIVKVDKADICPLDSLDAKRAALVVQQQADTADAAVFCDFGYGAITPGLLQRVLPACREKLHVLSADVSGTRGNLLAFKDMDLLCPTEREMRSSLHDFEQGLSSAAWRLMEQTRALHLLVTLDRRGLVAFDRQSSDADSPDFSARLRSEHIPALSDYAVDKLGCGDALLAAATLTLLAGGTLTEAGYLGSAAAALEVGMLGNIPVDRRELLSWLSHRRELAQAQPSWVLVNA